MLLIGETLNSSSPSVEAALRAGDRGWIAGCARRQLAAGVSVLDCNASALGDHEESLLEWMAAAVEPMGEGPVCLDSASVGILARVGRRRHRPPILNSVDCQVPWPEALVDLVRREGACLVVQLRRGGELPPDFETRLAWTGDVIEAAARADIPLERLFLDPVLLPWGDDLLEGAPVFRTIETVAGRWPALRTLVGLSNASWGRPDRSLVDCRWLEALRDCGLGAAILNPLDPVLMALASA